MKTTIKTIAAALFVATFGLTSCNTSEDLAPQTALTQQAANLAVLNTSESRVVQNFIAAINNNDRAAGLVLVSQNAGYAYSLTGTLNTGTSFTNWLESDLFGPRAVIQVESATQDGNVVRIQGRWGRNGNASNRADYYFTVQNDLITAWRLV
jgi:hypothetical protein